MKKTSVSGKDHVPQLLHNLSNPVRKGIIEALSERGQATFSDLLVLCDLDIYYQKGLLDYHLKTLYKSGILAKAKTGYILTGIGEMVAKFLESLESEYLRFFAIKNLEKGGEIVKLSIERLEEKDVEEVSIAKYGTNEKADDEMLWACGNKVPLKAMGWEWGKTISLKARSNGKIIGVLYGNTVPMHVVSKDDKELGVVQPTKDKPTNRLHGEIFEIWVHPDYEGHGVEKQLIKDFVDHMKEQGAVAVTAERVLTENETILNAFEELDFQKIASYQDLQIKI